MNSTKNIEKSSLTLLKDNELKQLCFLAYHGEDVKPASVTEYCKAFKISGKSYDEVVAKFNELGFVQGRSFVKKEWHIRILKDLYLNHSEWIEEFKSVSPFSRNSVAEYLCNIVKRILAGDYLGAAKIRRPYQGIEYKPINILTFLHEITEEDLRFIKEIDDRELQDMVKELLITLFSKDELSRETLVMLRNLISEKGKNNENLLSEIAAYDFFMYGVISDMNMSRNVWSEGVRAMQLLYQDKLEDSFEAFEIALRLHSKSCKSFETPILNYAYGIALYRISKRKGNSFDSRISAFLGDNNIRFKDDNICIRLLLESIDSGKEISQYRGQIHSKNNEKIHKSFLCILNHFCEKNVESYSSADLHSAAFFQYEMSAFRTIENGSKDKYHELFGGSPLVSKLRKRPKWEVAFKEIEDSISRLQKKEKRIAYYVNGYDLEAVVEQTKEEDGWQDGQVLSLTQMIMIGYDSMNETDSIIAKSLSNANCYENAARIIVPMLADSGRLFFSTHYDGNKTDVTIYKEKPFLSFEGKGDTIGISSNVRVGDDGVVQKHTLTYKGNGEYILVTINPFQKDIIKKFLSIGTIPLTAVVSLKKAIESLNGIIDVKDEQLDILMEPATLSKGILAVRITPNKDEYNIVIMATAIENGTARFTPSCGGQLVYDEVDNITYCINRDLDRESENFTLLKNYMDEELMCEFVSNTETTLYSAESLLHLITFIYDRQDRYFAEWPEGKTLHFKGDVCSRDIEISVKSETKWFCMDGKVTTNTLNLTLEALIRSCCETKIEGFVKISDNEYVRMSKELKQHIAALNSLSLHKGNNRIIPQFQVGALASMIRNLRFNEDGSHSRFMQQTKEAYNIKAEVPLTLNAKLRDYQIEGFRWMCRLSAWGAGACLADDMGLGKTIQTIAFLLYKALEGPSLVVAPKSIITNWENEIAKFAPSLHCINLNLEKKRLDVIQSAKENDVVLCTYGVMSTEELMLTGKDWNVVCLDEAHSIKNRNTIASRVCMELKSKNRLILTGTPIQNNLGELWNMFQFINPGLLGTWSVFRDSFMVPSPDSEHQALLKEMTMPFILRRTKRDVLSEMPEKLISEKYVELFDNEQKVYEEMRRRAEVKFKDYKTRAERIEAKTLDINFFTELMHLREAACSMKLVYDEWTDKSSKLIALMDILKSLMRDENNNVVVFSQFTGFLKLVMSELEHGKVPYLYLDGQTPLTKRKQYVDDFQEGRCRLFLSSLKAGGYGINLTKANYVILLDPWWNPSVENQAMDRAHRIGQKRVVTVIRLISAQTIEEKILNLHEEKQRLTEDILEGTGESTKLTYEDVMDMVAPF